MAFMVTLLPSTDCDIGRWLLQHYRVDYREHPHAPLFHILALKWYGFGADDYPLLVDGKKFEPMVDQILSHCESMAEAEKKLLPEDPALKKSVEDLQVHFRLTLGIGVVNWAYYNLLPYKNLTWASFTTGVPWYEKLSVALTYPLIRSLMIKGLNLNAEVAAEGLKKVYEGFDQVDAMLADGRSYLVGDRFTYADLAFAGAFAPMVLAKGYGGHLPELEKTPPKMREIIRQLRERPAGKFIQRLYDEHRHSP